MGDIDFSGKNSEVDCNTHSGNVRHASAEVFNVQLL